MTVDRYTKGVLTVIAGCLLWMCAMWAPGIVQAQQTSKDAGVWSGHAQPVVLVGIGAMDDKGKIVVYFTPHNGVQWTDPTVPVHAASPLPVSLPYTRSDALPVQITGVKKTAEWDPIRTQVEPESGRPKPGGGDR